MTRLRIGVVMFVVAALAAVWFVGSNWADDKPAPRIRGTLPAYYKKLGLSDEQTQSIYKIRATYRGQISELQAKIKSLQRKEKAELEKVLTPAQRDRLRELRTGEPTKDNTKPAGKTADKEPRKSGGKATKDK